MLPSLASYDYERPGPFGMAVAVAVAAHAAPHTNKHHQLALGN
jgi:hypothetical protein